ncbi:hypothetical protein [Kitasatospora sp. NPDC050543]|uniref:hypothetical protein n=1 Tax=Kitasatospora sp. NPDC050543 TaxID=3364054 RepID=UPI0037B2E701
MMRRPLPFRTRSRSRSLQRLAERIADRAALAPPPLPVAPPDRVTLLAIDLLRLTGEHAYIQRTASGGYRLAIRTPAGLDSDRIVALLDLLNRADRFGNTTATAWAELDPLR